MPTRKKFTTIDGVAEGGEFTLNMPIGPTYGKVKFTLGGTAFTPAHIQNLQLLLDGDPVQQYKTGTRLADFNARHGVPDAVDGSELTLHMSAPWMNPVWRQLTRMGTIGVKTLTIKGSISGSTAPTLKAEAVRYAPEPLGAYMVVKEIPTVFGAGEQEIDKVPRNPADRLLSAHFMANDFTRIEYEVNETIVFEGDKTQIQLHEKDAGFTPDTDWTAVDLLLDHEFSDALVLKNVYDHRFRVTKTGAGSADIVLEYLRGYTG